MPGAGTFDGSGPNGFGRIRWLDGRPNSASRGVLATRGFLNHTVRPSVTMAPTQTLVRALPGGGRGVFAGLPDHAAMTLFQAVPGLTASNIWVDVEMRMRAW
jgi:hypothetical protein